MGFRYGSVVLAVSPHAVPSPAGSSSRTMAWNACSAACRSSTISAASTSGSGRFSLSSSALSLSPQEVQIQLVALHQFVVLERSPASPRSPRSTSAPFVAFARPVAADEVVQVRTPERLHLEREVLVRAEVVDPYEAAPSTASHAAEGARVGLLES